MLIAWSISCATSSGRRSKLRMCASEVINESREIRGSEDAFGRSVDIRASTTHASGSLQSSKVRLWDSHRAIAVQSIQLERLQASGGSSRPAATSNVSLFIFVPPPFQGLIGETSYFVGLSQCVCDVCVLIKTPWRLRLRVKVLFEN